LPVSTTFTKTITETDTIDFSAHVSDQETTDADLTIKLTSLPTKGVLTVSGSDAVESTAYAVSVITYTSNANQCASSYTDFSSWGKSYTDFFSYKVVNPSNAESAESTVIISVKCSVVENL